MWSQSRVHAPRIAIILLTWMMALAACVGPGAPAPATPAPELAPTLAPTPEPTAMPTPTPEPTPAPTVAVQAPVGLAGTYSGMLPAGDTVTQTITLVLGEDGTATLTTQFADQAAPVVERGAWQADGNRALIKLTSVDGQPIADSITFEMQGEQLVAVEYDVAVYGDQGMTLMRREPAPGN